MLEKLQKSKYCGEVPATKLAALQKVLQSEFLNAVREVYEHVYETVDVQGNPEIRASATAKVRLIFRQIKVSKLLYFHDFLVKFYFMFLFSSNQSGIELNNPETLCFHDFFFINLTNFFVKSNCHLT